MYFYKFSDSIYCFFNLLRHSYPRVVPGKVSISNDAKYYYYLFNRDKRIQTPNKRKFEIILI